MPATPLLLRYLSGDATPEEAAMIDTWIQASEENKTIFQRLWNLWQQTTTNGGYATPDTQQEWKELVQKLPVATALPPRRRLIKQWQVVTAATVIAVMAVVILLLLKHPDNQPPAYTTQQSNNTIARDTLFHTIIATLDTHSNIQYPAVGKENKVLLLQGGLFLEAAANTGTPYHIEAGGVSIQPGNNSLSIQYDTVTAITTIQAVTGTLTIQAGTNTLTLQQGEAISWNNNKQAFSKKQGTDVNSYSYATRVFLFNDTPLQEAIRYLAKAYGVTINIQTPVISNCLITTRFDNKSIEYIMDIISATLHVNYDYQKAANTIYLQGDGCE